MLISPDLWIHYGNSIGANAYRSAQVWLQRSRIELRYPVEKRK